MTLMRLFAVVFLSAWFGLVGVSGGVAGELEAPTGKVLLRVSGAITQTTGPNVAEFDRAGLEALGTHSFTSSNPFVEGAVLFEGVLLRDLLAAVGAQGTTLQARALDGYVIDIPIEDALNYDVLLAMKRDGEWMRVRTKGPLWIVYPVDRHKELQDETFANRMIWQLSELTVKP